MFRSALRALPIGPLPVSDAPAFTRGVACAQLDAPFRDGVAAICRAPGEVVLYAQLPPRPDLDSVPLHWEIARDAQMRERERYGLITARPGTALQIALSALEKGRAYWYRLWAGGHWSHTGHFHSGVRQQREPSVRPLRPLLPRLAADHALRA